MLVLLTGTKTGLVCLHTQLLPFRKHLQCNVIEMNNMIITVAGVPMIENSLTFMGDQKLGVNQLYLHWK